MSEKNIKTIDLPPLGKLLTLQDAENYIRQLVRVIDQLNRRVLELERKQ
jgi:hypothetical protein